LRKAAHITINRIGTEQLSQFDDVVARGFVNGDDPAPLQGMFSTFAQVQNSIALVAYCDGHVAAGAGGLIIPERRMAALFGASTLPDFRDRGLQSALLHARLQLASEAGCDLAVVVTQPGSVSQRNAERAGFRVAYSKALLMRSCPA
jgi:GNAT superfamily N-acetyltransferase